MAKNRLDFQAHLSRHSHDISAGYTASIAPGLIVPQYFHILGPGDSIYYSNRMFARLQDMMTAFLGEIDIHIDSFFVPLQMLYTPFGQIFAQTDDFISDSFVPNSFTQKDGFPLFDIGTSLEALEISQFDSYNGENCVKNAARLLDALDVNPLICFNDYFKEERGYQSATAIDDQVCENPQVSPWIFAAYNAIYQKYYRNDEIERLRVSRYNFDSHYNESVFDDYNWLGTRYVQRPSDYFTNVRVSPIASAVNRFESYSGDMPSDGGTLPNALYRINSFLDSDNVVYKGTTTGFNDDPSSFVNLTTIGKQNVGSNNQFMLASAANIRALFAVDKFARIYGRADKTYDDQILAHFGIKIPHDVKHDLTHLSHFRAVLQSDPIYSTANTVNNDDDVISALGQVGGQGSVDFKSTQDKFTAPVHGVFMTVAYVVTKPRYTHTFSKLHMLNNRLSFPIPEYDKLGSQPVYAFEANPFYLQQDKRGIFIGWQNRYNQYKQKYNRASLTYFNGDYGHGQRANNIYKQWVISRPAYGRFSTWNVEQSGFIDPLLLFESPSALDDIMVAKFQTGWRDSWFETPYMMFQTDPILTEFMCNCKLVSWMSETGEPDL